MSGQITTNPSILQILVSRLREPVAAASRERAAQHVLDWLACSILGLKQSQMAGFISATTFSESGRCRTVNGQRADWWNALQINAACGNMLEMDDLDRASILHPGPVIIPAAIAVAETIDATGEQLCNAIVRGYEATIRIGRAMGTSHYQFFHNTSTCGTFGAAAAAADLLGLSATQTAWALANAGSRTGGLWQMRHEPCETKSLHNVMAAQAGVQAAMLALHGVRGPFSLVEGLQGLFSAMAPSGDPQHVIVDLQHDWRIHEVSFKPWPACRHAHPAIDAAIAVRSQIADFSAVRSITVKTYQSAIDFCDQPNPQTVMQAKFSLQHATAVALLTGAPRFADFDVENLNLAAVVALRKKVQLAEDPALTGTFPNHYGASIMVMMADGARIEHLQMDAKGDPEIPLSTRDIINKAATLFDEAGIDNTNAGGRDVATAANTTASQLIAATMAIHQKISVQEWTATWPPT